jgi:protein TonB
MSINLIESERRSERSVAGTFVSIALHATLITLAVYATASAGAVRVTTVPDTVIKFYPPQTTHASSRALERTRSRPRPMTPLPHEPGLEFPKAIPDSLPPVESPTTGIPIDSLFGSSGLGNAGRTAATSSSAGSDDPVSASEVDKPAVPRAGNRIPRYPSALESSRVEGRVLVQFGVDTLGSVDMSTFTVLESSNELFVRAFAETLSKWRFYPAEVGGRKVKQVAQLPLKFVAQHP